MHYSLVYRVPSAAIVASPVPSDALSVGDLSELAVDINVSAISGTTPTYQLLIERMGLDGEFYPIYTSPSIIAIGKTSVSLGVGASTNVSFGSYIRITETIGGTAGPSVTRSVSIIGKGA